MDLADGKRPELASHVNDWREEIIYQVLVDRFANGDASNDFNVHPDAPARGGDWRGLENHLDYIQELGVTAIWISPIVKNVETDAGVDGYHGYWAQDLTQLNPHFGDLGSLRRLVREAHNRGIKIILDIVTNHLGQLFYYDINQNGQPDIQIAESGQETDRFGNPKPVVHITEYDPDFDRRGVQSRTSLGEAGPAPIVFVYDPASSKLPAFPAIFQEARAYHRKGRVVDFEATVKRCAGDTAKGCDACPGDACIDYFEQTELGDFPGGLKDVATELPEVRDAMVDAYTRWIEETDIDGFRIDTLKHVEHAFWQDFAPRVRKRLAEQGKVNFLMFGESFDGSDERNGTYTRENEVDSVFYFSQKFQVYDNVFKRGGPTKSVQELWAKRETNYGTTPQPNGIGIPPSKALVNFLDNHDVSRFLFEKPDVRVLRNALTLLFTEDGIPCVYYGTEQDFTGGNDPANREDLWSSGYETGGDTFRHIAMLSHLRRTYPALTKGDLTVRWSTERTAEEEDAGILGFERRADPAYALVVINASERHESHTGFGKDHMRVSVPAGTVLVDVLGSGDRITVGSETGPDPVDPSKTGTFDVVDATVPATSARIFVPEAQLR
jgi:alpha-amylase